MVQDFFHLIQLKLETFQHALTVQVDTITTRKASPYACCVLWAGQPTFDLQYALHANLVSTVLMLLLLQQLPLLVVNLVLLVSANNRKQTRCATCVPQECFRWLGDQAAQGVLLDGRHCLKKTSGAVASHVQVATNLVHRVLTVLCAQLVSLPRANRKLVSNVKWVSIKMIQLLTLAFDARRATVCIKTK